VLSSEKDFGKKKLQPALKKRSLFYLFVFKRGDKDSLTRLKQNIKTNEKYQLNNFDLIAWFLVS